MKKLAIFLISIGFLACQNETKTVSTTDTTKRKDQADLSFKYDSVKVYSKHMMTSENGTDTSKAVIVYPVFADQQINHFIEQKVMSFADEGEHYKSYQDFSKSFIENFDKFSNENKGYGQTWFMEAKIEVVSQLPEYLSTLVTHVSYEGGAHPNSVFTYLNYDPSTHKEITLQSLILPGAMEKLNAVAEKIFRKNEKLSPDESLKDTYFFENDKFSINQNFTITSKGLKFLYNPYEIKAYAFGTTELIVPFAELKEIAKPNSLLNPAN